MSYLSGSSDPAWTGLRMKQEPMTVIKQEEGTINLQVSGKPKYSQRFCDKWLNIFSPWLARCDDDRNKPFCRACQCRLDCNRCHLQRHERTSKHARNLEILINKGEGGARQNLSIRQERSKYYQQRKRVRTSSNEDSDLGANDELIDEADLPDTEAAYQYEQTDPSASEQYMGVSSMTEEDDDDSLINRQDAIAVADIEKLMAQPNTRNSVGRPRKITKSVEDINISPKVGVPMRKDGIQLLMQIQKVKNDLTDSFKELIETMPQHSTSAKEKNHVDLFFESVSSSVKALTPKLIAEAKMRVSQLICELELRALTDANSSSPTLIVSPETGTSSYIMSQSASITSQHQQQSNNNNQSTSHHYESLS